MTVRRKRAGERNVLLAFAAGFSGLVDSHKFSQHAHKVRALLMWLCPPGNQTALLVNPVIAYIPSGIHPSPLTTCFLAGLTYLRMQDSPTDWGTVNQTQTRQQRDSFISPLPIMQYSTLSLPGIGLVQWTLELLTSFVTQDCVCLDLMPKGSQ